MSEQPITTSKRLVHNTFFNVAALLSNAVIGFFLIRFFLGQLGKVQYGVWLLIGGSIFGYAPLLSMGLNSAINRYVPVCLAKKDTDGLQRVISTSLLFYSGIGIVAVFITAIIYFNIGSWFAIEEADLVGTAGVLMLVVGFCFALAMPLQLFSGVLSGLQRYDITNLVLIITVLLRTAVLVVLLSQGHGLLTMGLSFGLSEIAMRLLQFFFVRRLLPHMSLSFANVDLQLLREMLVYGMNTFLYATGAVIIYKASTLIIGIFIGAAEISQYFIATAGVLLLSQLLRAFTAAIKPAVSDLDARNDEARVKEIAFLTQKYSVLLIIPSGCFLVAMGGEFLSVWVGSRFEGPVINEMAVILAILTVGHCLRLAQHSNFLVLVGRGQHKIFGVLTALTALLCVSASVVSVKVFNMGLVGIAWSNFLPMALISGVILPIYFNWKMRISVSESIRNVWQSLA
ncbi:MAG: lipopolysaccharide biosynthesis protein [Planctomycetota bacterium]|jgi:O-antigen/teichoic acid export membrane protein